MRSRVFSLAAAASLALAPCGSIADGRQQSWEFSSHYQPPELQGRASQQLLRTGYRIVRSEDRWIEAHKQSAPGSFDVLRIFILGASLAGTRVRVQAVSQERKRGAREEARVSSTALQDGDALVIALLSRVVPGVVVSRYRPQRANPGAAARLVADADAGLSRRTCSRAGGS